MVVERPEIFNRSVVQEKVLESLGIQNKDIVDKWKKDFLQENPIIHGSFGL